MTLADVVEKACAAPARLLGLEGKARLEPGADADVIVVGPDGTCRDSVIGGRLVMRGREIAIAGEGRMLRPPAGDPGRRTDASYAFVTPPARG